MRVVVELFREDNGRLEGVLELPDGQRDAFVSTLDLLRVLENLDLPHRPDLATGAATMSLTQSMNPGPRAEVTDD